MSKAITLSDFIGKERIGQHSGYHSVSRFGRIQGRRVLEIGGNSDCVAAQHFANAGAAQVVVSGLYHVDDSRPTNNPLIAVQRVDALDLANAYPAESFDIIYGISILEHIPNPDKLLAQIWHVLSKNGIVFLQGAPIWSGPWGHHIWLNTWTDHTTVCYQFLPTESLVARGVKVINPIPDWAHILCTPEEMAARLATQQIPDEDIKKILFAVYDGDAINRQSASDIYKAIHRSPFLIAELEFDRVSVPLVLQGELRQKCSETEDFSIMGIRTVLIKT